MLIGKTQALRARIRENPLKPRTCENRANLSGKRALRFRSLARASNLWGSSACYVFQRIRGPKLPGPLPYSSPRHLQSLRKRGLRGFGRPRGRSPGPQVACGRLACLAKAWRSRKGPMACTPRLFHHGGGFPMKKGDFVATALWLIVCAGFLLYGAGLALLG